MRQSNPDFRTGTLASPGSMKEQRAPEAHSATRNRSAGNPGKPQAVSPEAQDRVSFGPCVWVCFFFIMPVFEDQISQSEILSQPKTAGIELSPLRDRGTDPGHPFPAAHQLTSRTPNSIASPVPKPTMLFITTSAHCSVILS